jgi:hypothetical protein
MDPYLRDRFQRQCGELGFARGHYIVQCSSCGCRGNELRFVVVPLLQRMAMILIWRPNADCETGKVTLTAVPFFWVADIQSCDASLT